MSWDILFSLVTLTILEIVLGVDNLVFISILSSRLPLEKQKIARRLGLILALITRLILLAFALQIMGLVKPLFTIYNFSFSARDIFLLGGGIFLLVKATQEIHTELEFKTPKEKSQKKYANFYMVIFQIGLFDIIFSLDSILTAIGLTQNFKIMAIAIFIAILTMIFASEPLSRFINNHPSIKMLALSFLLLIGTALIADGFHFDIPRGYIYFSVSFSIFVETLNLILAKKRTLINDKKHQ